MRSAQRLVPSTANGVFLSQRDLALVDRNSYFSLLLATIPTFAGSPAGSPPASSAALSGKVQCHHTAGISPRLSPPACFATGWSWPGPGGLVTGVVANTENSVLTCAFRGGCSRWQRAVT